MFFSSSCTASESRINRNILECKLQYSAVAFCASVSINRNILECKCTWKATFDKCYIVLIETYWNVNEDDLVFLKNSFSVLIETYWNVNIAPYS